MRLIILATEVQQKEWLTVAPGPDVEITWNQPDDQHSGEMILIDLLFDGSAGSMDRIRSSPASLIFVHSLFAIPEVPGKNIVRINGWPSFLANTQLEADCPDEQIRRTANEVFSKLNRSLLWIGQVQGFIAPRILACIINEAHLASEEGIGTRADIDTAMKLGTNYPEGPFAWAEKIGYRNLFLLLNELKHLNPIYTPCNSIIQKALA